MEDDRPTLPELPGLEEASQRFVPLWEEDDLDGELTPVYVIMAEDIKNIFRWAEENERQPTSTEIHIHG
jgi:hypothetical protein